MIKGISVQMDVIQVTHPKERMIAIEIIIRMVTFRFSIRYSILPYRPFAENSSLKYSCIVEF